MLSRPNDNYLIKIFSERYLSEVVNGEYMERARRVVEIKTYVLRFAFVIYKGTENKTSL
jgi:hypothetical protein